MTTDGLKKMGAVNPELFPVLGAYVSYHRKLRLIDSCTTFATPPAFKGEGGKIVYLDEIGCHEDGAAAAIRNVTRGYYEKAAVKASNFLQEVYGATKEELQTWLDDVLPPEEPAKQLDAIVDGDKETDADDQSAEASATARPQRDRDEGEGSREEVNP